MGNSALPPKEMPLQSAAMSTLHLDDSPTIMNLHIQNTDVHSRNCEEINPCDCLRLILQERLPSW